MDTVPEKMTTPHYARLQARSGSHSANTSGICPGFGQGNLIVLPKEAAEDFKDLCFRNPVFCPLLGQTPSGNPRELDSKKVINDIDFDITTDIPKYNIYENGKLIATKSDIKDEWADDHIGFIIGCSFSFEHALIKSGLTPKHVLKGSNVSMFVTNIRLNPAGIFKDCHGVVSMRPYKLNYIEEVRSISRQFRKTHGEPIDWGFEALERLGIKNINNPEFGDPMDFDSDEIPVFWGCGVTPQIAVQQAGDEIKGKVMAHSPGYMLILDIEDNDIIQL